MYSGYFNVLPCLQLMAYKLLKCIIHTAHLRSITILNFTLHHFSPSSQRPKNTSIQLAVTEEKPTYLQDYMTLYPLSYIYYILSPY